MDYYPIYDLLDLLFNRYKEQECRFTKGDMYVFAESIRISENGEFRLNTLRNILNEWYNNLPDETKLKLELEDD